MIGCRADDLMWLRWPAALALVLAVSRPAAGEELWRAARPAGECRLVLVNELGGVSIGVGPSEDPATVVRGASELVIVSQEGQLDGASAGTEQPVLSVARDGDSPGEAMAGDVELSVPPGCDVAVRTTDGAVSLEVGREAFPVAVDTVTGDITARLDPDADAMVEVATSGDITTDFTIDIDFRYQEEPAKHGAVELKSLAIRSAPIAGGAIESGAVAMIRLTSRRGAVSVLQSTREQSQSR